ncbi:MAG: MoxR family ATPase [Candidatus Micrarchaeota archaeon]|nr:MoxR family ATPase [Candidatus Micrarchaeota archaeon]
MAKNPADDLKSEFQPYVKKIENVMSEIRKIVVGQEKPESILLNALFSDGHVLIEGVPGVAKTLLMMAIANVMGCQFKRIQFTPDMLPSDITGITTYTQEKGFSIVKGPIFTNFVLADEINRAPSKVQSAMLEAMQEKRVTIGTQTFILTKPFMVLATQNIVESLGVYPLPAAQLDRFMFKLFMDLPSPKEEIDILDKNITMFSLEDFGLKQILKPDDVLKLQELTKKVYVSKEVKEYIVRITEATRNPAKYHIELGKYIEYGASPRGSIGMYIGSKANALISGSHFATPKHVKEIAPEILSHRIVLNYEGQAEGIKPNDVIAEILKKVPVV